MSRFVPAGGSNEPSDLDGEWAKAREEIDTKRREKAEIGTQEGGKSLYETLQANKAAKQEQFEESIRLKNQFRSLDEDEVEFLDSVLESTRAKEAEVKKETREQLEAFRQQREEAERLAKQTEPAEPVALAETDWAVGPRRKRKVKEAVLGGAKLRKTSSTGQPETAAATKPLAKPSPAVLPKNSPSASPSETNKITAPPDPGFHRQVSAPAEKSKPSSPPVGLGLGAYSSDDSD